MISRLIPIFAVLSIVVAGIGLGLVIRQSRTIADQGDRITKVERAVTKRCKDACRDAIFERLRSVDVGGASNESANGADGSAADVSAPQGGDATTGSSPPSQPGPPSGGPPGNSGGNGNGGTGTQPTPTPGPTAETEPGLLSPVLDQVAPDLNCNAQVSAPGVDLNACN